MSGGRLVRRLLVALLVAAFVVTCLRLGWWQWQRFGLTGSAQNLGYTFQWPTFALFAIFMWWRLSKLEAQRRQRQARDAETATPPEPAERTRPGEPARPAARTSPGPVERSGTSPGPVERSGATEPTRPATAASAEPPDELDDELAAYNRYLAQLHTKESNRADRRAD
jgi:hypothetical protein